MEQRYREAEPRLPLGDDYPPYGTPPKQESWFWRKLPIIVVAIAIALIWYPAFAEESKTIMLTQGILCDTESQLQQQVDAFSSGEVSTMIDGCGELTQPVVAKVTPTTTYENRVMVVMMATIEIAGLPIQYSYIAFHMKPPETDA